MAAVIAAPTRRPLRSSGPALSELSASSPARVAPGARPAARPELRLIAGGRQAARAHLRASRRAGRLHPSVYQRRRLGVLVAAVAVAAVAYLALIGLGALLTPRSADAAAAGAQADVPASAAPVAAAPSDSAQAGGAVYVVRPGDTLWSIARRLQPSGDVRPLVDELAQRAGSGPLVAGASLPVDGLGD